MAAIGMAPLSTGGFAASSSLIGDWKANERQGQVLRDLSPNNNHGQLGSTPQVDINDPKWVLKGQAALEFDGDDFVQVENTPQLEPAKITVQARLRRLGSPGQFSYAISKGADGCYAASYGLYSGFGGGLAFYIYDGTAFIRSPEAGVTIWDGKWHSVAGTFDGTSVRLFVDGVEVGRGTPSTAAIAYNLPHNNRFYIGAYHGTCTFSFSGGIDTVRVWQRALTPDEIAATSG